MNTTTRTKGTKMVSEYGTTAKRYAVMTIRDNVHARLGGAPTAALIKASKAAKKISGGVVLAVCSDDFVWTLATDENRAAASLVWLEER